MHAIKCNFRPYVNYAAVESNVLRGWESCSMESDMNCASAVPVTLVRWIYNFKAIGKWSQSQMTNPLLLVVDSWCITSSISLHALVTLSGWPVIDTGCTSQHATHSSQTTLAVHHSMPHTLQSNHCVICHENGLHDAHKPGSSMFIASEKNLSWQKHEQYLQKLLWTYTVQHTSLCS